jgi:anti-sigma B factor antagonist
MPIPATANTLTFEIEPKRDTAVVHCHGRLTFGTTDALSAKVRQLIPATRCIVLDLTDVSHMDSMGLGAIVRLYVSAKSGGSSLRLINLGARIRQMLGITNLLSVLTDMCEQGVNIRF